MPSPTKHPDSGIYYFRVRVPAEIKAPLGKRTIKESLHTKDAAEARVRFTERYARANRDWAAQRAGPKRLTLRQIVALAGTRYRDNVAILGDDPGNPPVFNGVRS